MPVGLGHAAEASAAAHDGDGGVRQAGEAARQMAHMGPAAVPVAGETAYAMHTVLYGPVAAHQVRKLFGSGAFGAGRGEAPCHPEAALSGPGDPAFALDADGLAAAVEGGAAVPPGAGDAGRGTAAALEASVTLPAGPARGRAGEAGGPEVAVNGPLAVLDRGDGAVGAPPGKAACGPVPGVHRVHGDGAARDVDAAGEVPHGGDPVALLPGPACLSATPVPCPAAATVIRRPPSVRFDAPRMSLPSTASGVSAPACRAVHLPMASSSVSGGRSARMLWKVVTAGAVQRFLDGLKNAPAVSSRSWVSRAANRANAVTPR